MPPRPPRPCKKPGCGKLTTGIYCDEHTNTVKEQRQQYDKERSTTLARQLHVSKWWRVNRKLHLRVNPFCVECRKEGRLVMATVVDHIIPHKGDVDLFKDPSNWQSMCKHHHDVKTAREDGRWG